MWNEKILMKELDKYFDNVTKEQFLKDLQDANCLHLVEDVKDKPYLEGFEIRTIRKYNPAYGDGRICECGHTYYRHFDSYEDMDACGCKYCGCYEFKEKTE